MISKCFLNQIICRLRFRSVRAGPAHIYGKRLDSTIVCWGHSVDDKVAPPNGEFRSISTSEYYSCGVRTDGQIVCWGQTEEHAIPTTSDEFQSVSSGDERACGVKVDGSLECWGKGYGDHAPRWNFAFDGTPTPETTLYPPEGTVVKKVDFSYKPIVSHS